MKKKNFTKMFAVAALVATGVSNSFAQTNIGQDCGCPPFGSRPVEDLGSATYSVQTGANEGDLTASTTVLTCDKTYRLSKKIYVPDGKTISIAAGTVIIGDDLNTLGVGGQASALIVMRGGKIFASGTANCPIVFTASGDPMDGSYSIANREKWGGLVILGKATNNVKVGQSYSDGLNDGVAFIEGYLAADARNKHGRVAPAAADDNDNSGILRYVSIRHSGDILGTGVNNAGNELNGLSLGSVGRGTSIDHVEIVSCGDDGIELFGGTVNLKYISMLYGADDMLDYDLGWSGKAQFVFGLKAPESIAPTADNGIEADGDDDKSNATPFTNAQIYNATLIGNADATNNGDGSGAGGAAIKAKERVEGGVYNSVFMNWKNGLDLIKSIGTVRQGHIETYHNWLGVNSLGAPITPTLFVGCNTFINTSNANALSIANVGTSPSPVLATDLTKFGADNNVSINTAAATNLGLDFTFGINTIANQPGNTITDKYDAVPNVNIASGGCSTPVDGFFTPAPYRGAFEGGKKSWLADWSYLNLVPATQGLAPCPTDCNQDGKTDNLDFLQLLGQFNQNCN
jgi:hypothetical protein